jgi:hypothetical protein
MNEEAIESITDFLLEFQEKYHTGEPTMERFEQDNIVELIYTCLNNSSKDMYRDILNSGSFINKLKTNNIGTILAINFTKSRVMVEVLLIV